MMPLFTRPGNFRFAALRAAERAGNYRLVAHRDRSRRRAAGHGGHRIVRALRRKSLWRGSIIMKGKNNNYVGWLLTLLCGITIAVGQNTPGTLNYPATLDTPDTLFRVSDKAQSVLAAAVTSV